MSRPLPMTKAVQEAVKASIEEETASTFNYTKFIGALAERGWAIYPSTIKSFEFDRIEWDRLFKAYTDEEI